MIPPPIRRPRLSRTSLAVAIAVLALPLLAACGDFGHGTVTSKRYLSSHTTWRYKTKNHVKRRVPTYHSACYQLTVREKDGDLDTTCVSRSTYNTTRIGTTR